MNYWKRISFGGVVALLILLLPGIASAHTEPIRSDPADGAVLDRAPERVQVIFTEPIEPEFYALEVYDQSRVRVDQRDGRIPANNVAALEVSVPPLGAGTYTVVWRVLSIDSHVVRGSFAFSVGAAGTPVPLLDIPNGSTSFGLAATVRWWTFLFAFVLVGGLGFGPLVLLPALRAAGVTGVASAQRARRGFLWAAWPAVVLLLALSLVALLLQAAEATGVPLRDVLGGRAVTRLLAGTRYGIIWFARMGLLLGLLAVVAAVSVETRPQRWSRWVGVALGAGLLLTISLAGHAGAVPRGTAFAVAADWLHLLAGAVWIGGLVQIVLALFPVLRTLDPTQRSALLARTIRRFSLLAGLSVGVLIATGVYSGALHVPQWQALLDTSYGATLSGKLILFVPLLVLGAINLLVLHPRFVRAARSASPATNGATSHKWFRWLVLGEMVLAVLVLGATGILTGLPPATTTLSQPFSATQQAGDLNISLLVTPNQVGANQLAVVLADQNGQPVAAQRVAMTFTNLEMDMGQRDAKAAGVGPGSYQANEVLLSMAGRWEATVQIQRAGVADTTATFGFTLGPSPGSGRPAFSPARILWNALTPSSVLGVWAVVFAMVIVWQQRTTQDRRSRRDAFVIAGVVLAIGVYATSTSLAQAYRASLPNPVPATTASITRGQQLYAQNCATCHGLDGLGNGPAAAGLPEQPANLRDHMTSGHPDTDLFGWINGGFPQSGMPAFGSTLSQQDMWHLVNYIKTFAEGQNGAAN